MKKRKTLLMGTILFGIIGMIGLSYAFFSYTGKTNNSSLIAGDIYMHYNSSNAVIDSLNYNDNDNYYEFSVDGKNTSNKNIIYDINIVQGDSATGRTTRLDDKYLIFTLKEENENHEWVTVVENQSYSDLSSAVRIYADTINGATNNEIERNYRLYYTLGNGFLVSDTESNATYDEDTWNTDVYASVKVTVTGNFVDKTIDMITITFNPMGGTVSPTSKQVSPLATYGDLPTPVKGEYAFLGWTTTQNSTNYLEFSTPITNLSDHTIYANYAESTYTITLNKQNGTGGDNTVVAPYNDSIPTITVPTRSGYTFGGYYTGTNGSGAKYYNSDGTSEIIYTQANNLTLYAKWIPITYTIGYTLNGGSVTSANPNNYTIESSAITLNNPTKTGFTFSGWSGTDLTGSANTTVTIASGSTGNRAYTANFVVDAITGQAITATTNSINFGGTTATTVTITGGTENTTNRTYSSSDDSIAIVSSEGVVTGVAAGTATITVTLYDYENNVYTATVNITVTGVTASELKDAYVANSSSGLVAINNDGGLYNGTGTIREYRYSGVDNRWGGDVNNYIWFNNEMWRIVGIFKGDTDDGANAWNIKIMRDYPIGSYQGIEDAIQVPLIYESTGAGTKTLRGTTNHSVATQDSYPPFAYQSFCWNDGGTNSNYAYPSKSGILLWLNENRCDSSNRCSWYYQNYNSSTGINKEYENYIATTTFYTRAGNVSSTVAAEYNLERTNGTIYNSESTYTGKIGMLYPTDYAYASASTIWNGKSTTMANYHSTGGLSGNKLNNWILKPNDSSSGSWTILPSTSSQTGIIWQYNGSLNGGHSINSCYALRPVLSLKSSTVIARGTGEYNDPYMLENNKHLIIYNLNGGTEFGSANPNYYTSSTGTISLNIPLKTGFRFIGWTGSNGDTPQMNVTVNTSGLSENLHYVANWIGNNYTLTLNEGSLPGTVNGTQSVEVTYDSTTKNPSTITLASNPRTYTISGFGLDSSRKSNGASVSSSNNLTSRFTLQGYYTSESGGTKILNANATVTYASSNISEYVTNSKWTRASDATLYAQFNQSSVTLPTITKSGYTCGWTDSSGGTTIKYASGYTLTPSSSEILYGLCLLDDISINSFSVSNVYVGKRTQTNLDYNGQYETIAYASSNTSVATIDANGLITGVAVGTTSITVTMTDYEGNESTETISDISVIEMSGNNVYDLMDGYTTGATSGLVAVNNNGGLYTGASGQTIREYRYSGVDSRWSNDAGTVKNYITFNNEMWRIVGFFKGDTDDGKNAWNIKIIRDYPIGSYNGTADTIQVPSSYASNEAGTKSLAAGTNSVAASDSYPAFIAQSVRWNSDNYPYPSESGILLWLNEESNSESWYYKNYDSGVGINTVYGNYIATTTFYTRAAPYINNSPATSYTAERTNGIAYNDEATFIGKVGMLNMSDYGYAAEYTITNNWGLAMQNYASSNVLNSTTGKLKNWILKPNDNSSLNWTISPSSLCSQCAFEWESSGAMDGGHSVNQAGAIRPVLSLKSDTLLNASGDGSYSNPYVISGT